MPRTKAERSRDARGDAWRAVGREALEAWAGAKAVGRGEAYRAEGRVVDLALAGDDGLLATVEGTEPYATHVWLEPAGRGRAPESECSCPVGYACKHAVAVVLEYLAALDEGREPPAASDDDPRWYELDVPEDRGEEDDPGAWRRRSPKATREWDAKVRGHLRSLSQPELADLAWALVQKSPHDYEAIRERLALRELDPAGLVEEARREIRAATSVQPWRNPWEGRGVLPDYRPVRRLLTRLLELGRADDVAELGRELIREGFAQVGRADDEGETVDRLARCFPVVFDAVARSGLAPAERLLFAIDAELADPIDVVGDAASVVFESPLRPEDWSAAADALAGRLESHPGSSPSDDFHDRWGRDQLSGWVAVALEKAGRQAEVRPLYEAEARRTASFERLVEFLIQGGELDDAERWAREGIAAVIGPAPGTAERLLGRLRDLAARRGRWDVVAAHVAREFFDHPGVRTLVALVDAAAKAGVERPVRDAALRFLKTGDRPYGVVKPRLARGKARGRTSKEAVERSRAAAGPLVTTDPKWPLPVPDELVPFLLDREPWGPSGPHWSVLLDLALEAGDPDEVLRWYDKLLAAEKKAGYAGHSGSYHVAVAEAVAGCHPERALAILRSRLDALLPIAEPDAYDACTDCLARLAPVHHALGRDAEWDALLASIRQKHRNRPRFMERLDRAFGRAPG